MMNHSPATDRRRFLFGGAALACSLAFAKQSLAQASENGAVAGKFSLKFAPHPGTFKAHAGDDILEQIRYAAAQGFTAWEDNGLPNRAPEFQEKIGNTLREVGMTMPHTWKTRKDPLADRQ